MPVARAAMMTVPLMMKSTCRRRIALALLAFSLAGCATGPRYRYDAGSDFSSDVQSRLDRANREIAELRQETGQAQEQMRTVEAQLAKQTDVQQVLEKRIANLRDENDRLHADLTGVVMNAAGDRRPNTNAIINVSNQRSAGFELPPGLSDRLQAFAKKFNGASYDASDRVVRFETAAAFVAGGDRLTPEMKAACKDLTAILNDPAARKLNLLIVGHTAKPVIGRELAPHHPTDWHLAAHQAIAVEQALEETGMAGLRVGVASYASQQPLLESNSPANARVEVFILPPDPPADR